MYPRLSDIFRDFFGFTLPFPIYSFGAMVAVGVLTAMWLTRRELDRMYAAGRIGGVRMKVEDGKGKPRTREESPSAILGTVTVMAVLLGIAGSKLFHILENLDDFGRDPLGMIFSTGGLSFYGGLIVAGVSIALYLRKKSVAKWAFADAVAPGLMLAYGIGRIGCHLAGDGDWGIVADMSARPSWVPNWLWAETYPNNILGIDIPDPGVYPTSIYEFVFAAFLFGVLWVYRKHPYRNGWLFSFYLILNGLERFMIEQIRVNNLFEFAGISFTQAEFIAVLMVVGGFIGLAFTWRAREDIPTTQPPPERTVPTAA